MIGLLLGMALLLQGGAGPQGQSAVLSGQILTSDGKPAVDARVTVMIASESTETGEDSIVGLTKTDSAGRYRLENVPPGRYYVTAGRVDSPTYFPGASTKSKATIVTVGRGESTLEFNFTMAVTPTHVTVAGRVVASNGEAFPSEVAVTGRIRVVGKLQYLGRFKPDGSFELQNLPVGTYRIQVLGLGVYQSTSLDAYRDITGLRVVLPAIQGMPVTLR